jgi:hypothetical protein
MKMHGGVDVYIYALFGREWSASLPSRFPHGIFNAPSTYYREIVEVNVKLSL